MWHTHWDGQYQTIKQFDNTMFGCAGGISNNRYSLMMKGSVKISILQLFHEGKHEYTSR